MRHKKAAQRNIGLDLDAKVIERWQSDFPGICELQHIDAVTFLETYPFEGQELVYADPPYVPKTRHRQKVYRCDYSESDHIRLLRCLAALPCKVVLSGYESDLYNRELPGWRKATFSSKTHTEVREETVWMNFGAPCRLHDSSHIGDTFRERQTIQRRQARLRARIDSLDPIERYDLLQWMQDHYGNTEEVA